MIDPISFQLAMEERWLNFGNKPNGALRSNWKLLCEVFNQHIENPESEDWSVVPFPCGSGKSQGLVNYCGLLASQNLAPGVLVITRFIDEATQMADQINSLAGRQYAVAYHSQSKDEIPLRTVMNKPVLIITHRMYQMALSSILSQESDYITTWPYFHTFELELDVDADDFCAKDVINSGGIIGQRKLSVIDECLDICDLHSLSINELKRLKRNLSEWFDQAPHLRKQFGREYDLITRAINELKLLVSAAHGHRNLWGRKIQKKLLFGLNTDMADLDFRGLIKKVMKAPWDLILEGRAYWPLKQRKQEQNVATLSALHYVLQSWAYHCNVGKDEVWQTGRLLLPPGISGPVVLDATAKANTVYQVFDKAKIVMSAENCRDYSSVSLHYCEGHATGKNKLEENAKKFARGLIGNLNERLKGRNVLIVSHMRVEAELEKFTPEFNMKLAHWWKIDGRNDLRDCDAVVLFGLPWLAPTWPDSVFMTFQGIQSDLWLNGDADLSFKHFKDIKKALMYGYIASCVIQAVNRTRCRGTTDENGGCLPVDVFIMFPNKPTTESVLDAIREGMPGIRIRKDWAFNVSKRKSRPAPARERFIKTLARIKAGQYTREDVCRIAGIHVRSLASLLKEYISGGELKSLLDKMGVVYQVEGAGSSRKGLFSKG